MKRLKQQGLIAPPAAVRFQHPLQVWNQINCRSLTPDRSGFAGLFRNPLFLAIASLTVVGQVLIVHFGGAVFAVEPLGWGDWLVIAAGTAVVLAYAEAVRFVRRTWRGGTESGARSGETRPWHDANDRGSGRRGSAGT